jgi:hypothetical protein
LDFHIEKEHSFFTRAKEVVLSQTF